MRTRIMLGKDACYKLSVMDRLKNIVHCLVAPIFLVIYRRITRKKYKLKEEDIIKVNDFFCTYNGFRTLDRCVAITGLDKGYCAEIKDYLYKNRKLGAYYFEENSPPQKYMRKFILEEYPQINNNSLILEIGPGEHPIFPYTEYSDWFAVDKNYEDRSIIYQSKVWAKGYYPNNRIFNARWENVVESFELTDLIGKFDLVVASHCYEHVFRPIEALKQANAMLRRGGLLIMFVPDGYSEDPILIDTTHTLYLIPEMIYEFFEYAGNYTNITIKPFRPNDDLVVTAVKV